MTMPVRTATDVMVAGWRALLCKSRLGDLAVSRAWIGRHACLAVGQDTFPGAGERIRCRGRRQSEDQARDQERRKAGEGGRNSRHGRVYSLRAAAMKTTIERAADTRPPGTGSRENRAIEMGHLPSQRDDASCPQDEGLDIRGTCIL
jgi:hypothetical protein